MDDDLKKMVEDSITNVYCEVDSSDEQKDINLEEAQRYLLELSKKSDGSLFDKIVNSLEDMGKSSRGKRK